MQRQRVEALFERQIDLLEARDVLGLMALYRTPLPVYHPAGLKVAVSSAEMSFAIGRIFNGMDSLGVKKVSIDLREVSEAKRPGHVSALVDIKYLDSGRSVLRQSRIRYYLNDSDAGLTIVMAEYLETGFLGVLQEMGARMS